MATTTTLEVLRKKNFIAKSSNLLLGKKWRMNTNLHRGSPNIFSESTMEEAGRGCVVGAGAEDRGQRPL